jgi:hypothetical protein
MCLPLLAYLHDTCECTSYLSLSSPRLCPSFCFSFPMCLHAVRTHIQAAGCAWAFPPRLRLLSLSLISLLFPPTVTPSLAYRHLHTRTRSWVRLGLPRLVYALNLFELLLRAAAGAPAVTASSPPAFHEPQSGRPSDPSQSLSSPRGRNPSAAAEAAKQGAVAGLPDGVAAAALSGCLSFGAGGALPLALALVQLRLLLTAADGPGPPGSRMVPIPSCFHISRGELLRRLLRIPFGCNYPGLESCCEGKPATWRMRPPRRRVWRASFIYNGHLGHRASRCNLSMLVNFFRLCFSAGWGLDWSLCSGP